jgi:hypothetical protein
MTFKHSENILLAESLSLNINAFRVLFKKFILKILFLNYLSIFDAFLSLTYLHMQRERERERERERYPYNLTSEIIISDFP